MGRRPSVTCAELEPLLRETWRGPTEAFEVLVRNEAVWARVVAHQANRRSHVLAMELGEVASEVMVRLVERGLEQGGLTRPADCERADPTNWLRLVARNETESLVGAKRSTRARVGAKTRSGWDPDRGNLYDRRADPTSPDPAARADAHFRLQKMREAVREPDLPPPHALAAVLLHWPDLLDRPLVERACAHGAESGDGPLRDVEATWTLLQAWLAEHEDRPSSRDSRLHLAWVLRSEDEASPEAWRISDPEAVRRARDLLRKWDARGKERLKRVIR